MYMVAFRNWQFIGLVLLTGLSSVRASIDADEATIAVASNFSAAAQQLAADFENKSGHKVNLVFGSSGRFYAQISNAAPFDAFLSADQEKPLALVENELAIADSLFTYARGALVLWSADSEKVNNSVDVLRSNSFNKIAIANPRLAPYGVAANELIERLGLRNDLSKKMVLGENIVQTYQFVATENVEIGLVAYSQVFFTGQLSAGSVWIVPEELYDPIRQDAVLLNRGQSNRAASAFLEFVKSSEGQTTIQSFGYRAGES